MKVRIAFATTRDGNVDVDRVGSIEDHPDEDAKALIRQDVAAAATEQEVADWESELARRAGTADGAGEPNPEPAPTGEAEQRADTRRPRRNRISGRHEGDVDDTPQFASGGVIYGPSDPGDDRVPAVLGSHPPVVPPSN